MHIFTLTPKHVNMRGVGIIAQTQVKDRQFFTVNKEQKNWMKMAIQKRKLYCIPNVRVKPALPSSLSEQLSLLIKIKFPSGFLRCSKLLLQKKRIWNPLDPFQQHCIDRLHDCHSPDTSSSQHLLHFLEYLQRPDEWKITFPVTLSSQQVMAPVLLKSDFQRSSLHLFLCVFPGTNSS